MARRHFPLERGGPKRIHLRWSWGHRRFQVALDEGPPWSIERDALRQGVTLTLPDGSGLLVHHLKRRWYSVGVPDELRVERDGVPVPGSDGDPRLIGRQMGLIVLFFALFRFAALLDRTGEIDAWGWLLADVAALFTLSTLAILGRRLPVLLAAIPFALELLAVPSLAVLNLLLAAELLIAWRRMKPRARVPNLREIFE